MPIGEIIGLGLGTLGNLAGVNQQQDMMNLQYINQRKLNEQGLKMQKEMWDYTNYENQVEHMKNAGLNVGLMYGVLEEEELQLEVKAVECNWR